MLLVSSCSCLCPIHWSQVLCREWRCSRNSADRQWSNYIWVINNFIALKGAPYIKGLTVYEFLRLGCCPRPILWVWQHQAMSDTGSPSLPCGSRAARPEILTSVFTHSDHVFLDLSDPLVPIIGRSVTDYMQNMERCTCQYHLNCRLWGTAVISSMPSFCSREAVGVFSWFLVPQIQQIMSQCRSEVFGSHISLQGVSSFTMCFPTNIYGRAWFSSILAYRYMDWYRKSTSVVQM